MAYSKLEWTTSTAITPERLNEREDIINRMNSVISDDSFINGAGFHNSVYRGKDLGTSVTDNQYAAILNGTFEDLFIGDYWTINNVVYRIAAFDYYLGCGDVDLTTHHAVIVPDKKLYNAQMHNTDSGGYENGSANTTVGGYVGSDMYTTNLEQAKNTIKNAFSGHVLKHRLYLINMVSSNGYSSAGTWCDSEVDLMCEQMVYGSSCFAPIGNGSFTPANYKVEKSQLPLFRYRHDLIAIRDNYWLRDVLSGAYFAYVYYHGYAGCRDASYSFGVRPVFCIS